MLKTAIFLILSLSVILSQRQNCLQVPSGNLLLDSKNAQLMGGMTRTQGAFTQLALQLSQTGKGVFIDQYFGGDLTVKFSLYLDQYTANAKIARFEGDTNTDSINIGLDLANQLYIEVIGSQPILYMKGDVLELNQWMHFVILFGNSQANVKVYKNNVDVSNQFTATVNNNFNGVPTVERFEMIIGEGFQSGKLDEFLLYTRLVNLEEIGCLNDVCQQNCGGQPTTPTRICDDSEFDLYVDDSNFVLRGGAERVEGALGGFQAIECQSQYQQYADLNFNDIGRDNITISFWLHARQQTHYGRIFEIGNGPDADNIVLSREGSTNDLQIDIRDGRNKILGRSVRDAILHYEWHHYSVVIQFPSVKFYRDGVELTNIGTNFHNSQYTEIPSATRGQNYLCRSSWTGDGYFDGTIDQFKIYNQVLSDKQHKCLANKCDQYCDSCKTSSDNCLNCQANRVGAQCSCPNQHRDIGIASCEAVVDCGCPANFVKDQNSPGVCSCPLKYTDCPNTFNPNTCSC